MKHEWHRNFLTFNDSASRFDVNVMVAGLGTDLMKWSMPKFASDCFFRLYLPLAGKCKVIFTNGDLEIAPGKLYLLPPFLPLTFKGIIPFTHYYIHFSSIELYDILPKEQVFSEKHKRHASLKKLFQRILEIMKNSQNATSCAESFETRSIVEKLLIPFIDSHHIEECHAQYPDQRFSDILQYIEKNLHEKISVTNLQKKMNMSRSDFATTFKNRLGTSPKQYILTRKFSLAKQLLVTTNLSIKEIAERCGYPDEFFFSRLFKRNFYISPRDFRKGKLK